MKLSMKFMVTVKTDHPSEIRCKDIKKWINQGIRDNLNTAYGYIHSTDDIEDRRAVMDYIEIIENLKIKVNLLKGA
jgi:hypothetical protein